MSTSKDARRLEEYKLPVPTSLSKRKFKNVNIYDAREKTHKFIYWQKVFKNLNHQN